MVIFKELSFGDTLYSVRTKHNVVNRNKVTMTDDSGIEWHRYDKPRVVYYIEKIVYTGKVIFVKEGEVGFDQDRLNEYYFKFEDGQIHLDYEYADETLDTWFTTEQEAEQYIADKE